MQVLHFGGELTAMTVSSLHSALSDATAPVVILVLAGVTRSDSSALGALVRAHLRFQRMGRRLALVCVHGFLERMLKTTGLIEVLDVVQTPEETQASFLPFSVSEHAQNIGTLPK